MNVGQNVVMSEIVFRKRGWDEDMIGRRKEACKEGE